MDNFILLSVLGVLTIYFYSNMNVYKSLLIKTDEEKKILEEKVQNLEELKSKYERQVEFSLSTINDSQESLKHSREDIQKLKLKNSELEHRNRVLQERINDLYASVGTVY